MALTATVSPHKNISASVSGSESTATTISSSRDNVSVAISPANTIQVTHYSINYDTIELGDMTDLDIAGQSDGALLEFVGTTQKWTAKTTIQNANTIINGGYY